MERVTRSTGDVDFHDIILVDEVRLLGDIEISSDIGSVQDLEQGYRMVRMCSQPEGWTAYSGRMAAYRS